MEGKWLAMAVIAFFVMLGVVGVMARLPQSPETICAAQPVMSDFCKAIAEKMKP